MNNSNKLVKSGLSHLLESGVKSSILPVSFTKSGNHELCLSIDCSGVSVFDVTDERGSVIDSLENIDDAIQCYKEYHLC